VKKGLAQIRKREGRVMRVAALYDIHGNLPALEAVLGEVRNDGVDLIVVGGDVVPGPMPRETIAMLLDLPFAVQCITGNGDRDVLATRRGEVPARVPQRLHRAMHWVAGELAPEHVSTLATWTPTLTLEIPGLGDVMFCHATPRDDNELFTRLTPEDRLTPVFESAGADLVVCGHTHMQFDRKIGEVRVVNAGSVGMPFGNPGAYWLILGPDVDFRLAGYDVAAATERIRATAYPGAREFELINPPSEAQMLQVFESAAPR
jgi:putative phosphoesterase